MGDERTKRTEDAIWGRLLGSRKPRLPEDAARFIVALDFPDADKKRMRELAGKARAGDLSPKEREEIEVYGRVGAVLSILKSRARRSIGPEMGTRKRS